MSADANDEFEIKLTYAEVTVPPEWVRQMEREELVARERERDQYASESVTMFVESRDGERRDSDPDLDAMTENEQTNWAYTGDHPRFESKRRRALLHAWELEHPRKRSAPVAPTAATPTDWLGNKITAASWDDSTPPVAPTVGRIEGSVGALFVKGRVSRLYGASGSGKSWVAKKASLEVVSGGGSVLYLDCDGIFEDFRNHLKLMGIRRDDALSGRLHYVRVEASLNSPAVRDLLTGTPWSVVVLDGFNVALSVSAPSGKSGHDASEVDSFFAAVLRPAENVGAAVIVIDHAKKGSDEDHGSIQKRNNLTGTDYMIKRAGMIAKGSKGHAEITLTAKDRPGWATSEQAKRGKTLDDVFAYAVIDSTAQEGSVVVTVELGLPLDLLGVAKLPELNKDADSLRRLLAAVPDGFESNSKIRIALKERGWDMDNNRINKAASVLVAGNEAWRASGRGGALSLKPGVRP